ncbi:hypothetical protein MKZ20_20220 [Psychrobacillus sp. FSL K6-2684]|uniref:hypothetical protein n=1 Tax=Psychrobacillus sp. FSL K6-2684 TaxID=2921547 RepID=UPI0030F87F9F
MKVEIRKTAAGTEYWDNVEKRTVFVPKGNKPDFEVNENPTTMLVGADFAKDKDVKVDNSDINLDQMNAEQLRDFAKQNNIEIPFNVKKTETILKHIEEALEKETDDK